MFQISLFRVKLTKNPIDPSIIPKAVANILVIHFKKLLFVMIYQECPTAVGRNIVEIVDTFKL
jgi:hypothetical protein